MVKYLILSLALVGASASAQEAITTPNPETLLRKLEKARLECVEAQTELRKQGYSIQFNRSEHPWGVYVRSGDPCESDGYTSVYRTLEIKLK